jgi:hypothetical protein
LIKNRAEYLVCGLCHTVDLLPGNELVGWYNGCVSRTERCLIFRNLNGTEKMIQAPNMMRNGRWRVTIRPGMVDHRIRRFYDDELSSGEESNPGWQ